jgi:hypothetical protein
VRYLFKEERREIATMASELAVPSDAFLEFLRSKEGMKGREAAEEALEQIRELHSLAGELGYLNDDRRLGTLNRYMRMHGVENALAALQRQGEMSGMEAAA